MWSLVKIIDEDDYDAVPNSWIIPNRNAMKYPKERPASITRMAMNGEPITGDFDTMEISIIKKNFETYDDAYEACVRAAHGRRSKSSSERDVERKRKKFVPKHLVESLSSDDEKKRRNKKLKTKQRKKPTISDDDADEESTEEQVEKDNQKKKDKSCIQEFMERTKSCAFPTPPSFGASSERCSETASKVSSKHHSNDFSNVSSKHHSKDFSNVSSKHHSKDFSNDTSENFPEDSDFMKVSRGSPCNMGSPLKTFSPSPPKSFSRGSVVKDLFTADTADKRNTADKKTIQCKLGKKVKHFCPIRLQCAPTDAIMHTLCNMSADITDIKVKQKKSKIMNAAREDLKIPKTEFPENFEEKVPLNDITDFQELEEKLKTDNAFFDQLAGAYAWKGRNDANITRSARRVAKGILTDNVLRKYSMKGGHTNNNKEKKKPFNNLMTYSLILKVVKTIWQDRYMDYAEEANKTLRSMLTSCNKSKASE